VLQSRKPVLQVATAQLPVVHVGVPLATEQTRPQVPQLDTLVLVLVSHPLLYVPSQFAKPVRHEATVQFPVVQPGVPLATWQAMAQVPQ
jgi:hypothetical protein